MMKCKNCFHEEACATWIHHGETLYDDFDYSIDTCPYYDEVVHGQWNDNPGVFGHICDQCNKVIVVEYFDGEMNYCPNCGAKMDGDGNG